MDSCGPKILNIRILLTCFGAVVLRYFLMTSKYQPIIANHVEVSTPLNSWKRVSEGLFLMSRNVDPYSGDLLHETPLSLQIYKVLLNLFSERTDLMFITLDVLTGLLLYLMALKYRRDLYKEEKENEHLFAEDASEYKISAGDASKSASYVLLAFLFNPFTLLNCIGCSTTVFHNFLLANMLFALVHNMSLVCAVALALCASISFYPLMLIVPTSLYFIHKSRSTLKTICFVCSFLFSLGSILYYCSNFGTDLSFFRNVYGCILSVPDLQPNIGLFWYFFTEMFDHFRDLFIYAFQINVSLLYLVPLSIKFKKYPFLLTVSIIFIHAIFKSYPSVGDVGFVFSLLPCFLHLFSFSQQSFLVGVILLISSSLAPIWWYLWIYCNSANANFYFGATLAFAIAQIFLLTDILFAHVKREFILVHGKDRKIEGSEGVLCLE